ncbi:MAG: (d)CMP kinase [Nitrospiraceae bacterium]|nr:(d)CMP kinase [Nitrospiraceae bacterium]
MGKVVAIDGPSGAGKSTIAKALAEKLGFQYLDTGALYRATGLALIEHGVTPESDDAQIKKALDGIAVTFSDGHVLVNGEDFSPRIRTREAGHYSSVFSARRPVREFLLPVQKAFADSADIVAEGRDMATVVFPGAWKKFFLDASTRERAGRRYRQMLDSGKAVTMEDAVQDVMERDERDSSRDIAPLKVSPDAVYIDSTDMKPEDVIRRMLEEAAR